MRTQIKQLNEIFEITKGKKVSVINKKTERSIPYLLIDTLRGKEPEFFTKDEKYTLAEEKDILMVFDGTNSGLVSTGLKGAVGSTIARLRLKKDMNTKYITYFLSFNFFNLNQDIKGSAIPHIKPKKLLELEIRYPSLGEQQLIVSAIETQFTRLEEAVKVLKSVKEKLRIYRKAVLKKAFEKKEDWQENKIKDICKLINGRAFKPSEWVGKGLPIIRIQNLNNEEAQFNYCDFEIDEKFYVDNGNLLFAWSGTPGTSFGAHIWKRGRAVLNQHIFKVEVNEKEINKLFFMHLLNKNVQEYIQKAHGTAGLAHITKGKFEEAKISFPFLPEQQKIIQEIESKFSVIDKVEEIVNQSLIKAEKLRKSILKSAFEGRLIKFDEVKGK